MNRLVFPALLGLSLVLGAGLAAEIVWAMRAAPPSPGHLPLAVAQGAGAAAPLADQAPAWVATALARPLFAVTRRPPPPSAAAGAMAAPALPRLAGVMVTPQRRTALFAAAKGAKPVVVAEGDHLAGFTIVTIDTDAVTVAGPGGTRRIKPGFAVGAEVPPTTPPASGAEAYRERLFGPRASIDITAGPTAAANADPVGSPAGDPAGNPVANPTGLDLLRNTKNIPNPVAPKR